MVNNAAFGEGERGGGGRGMSYIMCIAHQQRYCVIRSIPMQGLSFKCVALCLLKFTIYIKTIIKGNAGLVILS